MQNYLYMLVRKYVRKNDYKMDNLFKLICEVVYIANRIQILVITFRLVCYKSQNQETSRLHDTPDCSGKTDRQNSLLLDKRIH